MSHQRLSSQPRPVINTCHSKLTTDVGLTKDSEITIGSRAWILLQLVVTLLVGDCVRQAHYCTTWADVVRVRNTLFSGQVFVFITIANRESGQSRGPRQRRVEAGLKRGPTKGARFQERLHSTVASTMLDMLTLSSYSTQVRYFM